MKNVDAYDKAMDKWRALNRQVDSKSGLSSTAISAVAASKPHSNNSYHWVQSTKTVTQPRAAPRPSGLRYPSLPVEELLDESSVKEIPSEESMQEQTDPKT